MLGYAYGAIRQGADVQIVRVQADVGPGFPRFTIVGLPDSSVSEAKARVRNAFHHSGLPFPKGRITVNLQPASIRKQGSWLDLAIAVAILRASSPQPIPGDATVFVAELALDGSLVPQSGLSAIGLHMYNEGLNHLCISQDQRLPWPFHRRFHVLRARDLADVVEQLRDPREPALDKTEIRNRFERNLHVPFHIGGRAELRLLSICAAGRHAMMLVGPPGVGKTTLADALVHLLPDLPEDHALEVAAWQEIVDPDYIFSLRPPVRKPHHTISPKGLLGGGRWGTPGEFTLSHHGVLLLDEMLEFTHTALNTLREPMDRGFIECSVLGKPTELPADFQLVATANPCPCGYHGYGDCACLDVDVRRYWSRCPGPILDRIDIIHHVNRAAGRDEKQDDLNACAARVREARAILTHRPTGPRLSEAADRALRLACHQLRASERDREKLTALARTLAALDGQEDILVPHVEEAMIWRRPGSMSPTRHALAVPQKKSIGGDI